MILLKGSLEKIGLPKTTGINHRSKGKMPAMIKIDRTNFLSFLKSKRYANMIRAIKPVKTLKKYFILSISMKASEIIKILIKLNIRKISQIMLSGCRNILGRW